MVKKLSRKLVAAGAIAGGLAILAPTAGIAAPVNGIIDVPAGQRRCIDNPQIGYRNASVTDFVVSGHRVKFVFLAKPLNAAGFTEVGNSGTDPVSSYASYITPASHPWAFPGVFRTCANNMSDKPSRVSLTVSVDS
jgi:hypothetical protein